MKAKTILLILGLIATIQLSAQQKNSPTTDSLQIARDSLNQPFSKQELKLQTPRAREYSFPQNKYFLKRKTGESLAFKNDSNALFLSGPNYRMPVVSPRYHSNMPVMKPDSTIHFHLLIKK